MCVRVADSAVGVDALEALGLGLRAQSAHIDALSVQLNLALAEAEAVLNDAGELANAAALLACVRPGGHDIRRGQTASRVAGKGRQQRHRTQRLGKHPCTLRSTGCAAATAWPCSHKQEAGHPSNAPSTSCARAARMMISVFIWPRRTSTPEKPNSPNSRWKS